MPDPAILEFFDERKQAWLKKEVKSLMNDDLIQEKHVEADFKFSFEQWLPYAAKRARQISIATHPCTFSHPSARNSKNGSVTSIIAKADFQADGFLRTGNIEVEPDALGNAGVLDVYKFLTLIMEDGQTLLKHIEQETVLAQVLLNIESRSFEQLRQGFLAMTSSDSDQVTSSKIKQVYFPVPDETASEGYHQLSVLTHSGIVFEMRRRIDAIRFGIDEALMSEADKEKYLIQEELKTAKEKRRNKQYSPKTFDEIYGLATIGYGGTQPQNISALNSQNGGKAHLLISSPPALEVRGFLFPTSDFFTQSVSPYQTKPALEALHRIFKAYANEPVIPKENLKTEPDNRLAGILDRIVDNMWKARKVASMQYIESTSKLPLWQKQWLLEEFAEFRQQDEQWLITLIEAIRKWLAAGYKKLISRPCDLGDSEIEFIQEFIEQYKEALR